MVLYKNALLKVATLTTTKNAEGTKIKTYDFTNPLSSFRADVQPNTLTKEQIDLFGINTKTAKTKKVFYEGYNAYMKAGNRVQVNYDNGAVEVYNICPVNEWRNHSEVLLVPVENE